MQVHSGQAHADRANADRAQSVVETPSAGPGNRKPAAATKRRIPVAVLALLVGLLGLITAVVITPRLRPHLYAGTVLQHGEPAPPLDGLEFASGAPADLTAFDQQVVLIFFGYTNCPDVCPMTLSTVRRALDGLDPEQRDRVNTMMVSVDPERDDLASLQQYLEFFDPSFRGVGGPTAAIERAATRYGVFYETTRGGENYLIDHTATLMGIGTDGVLRIVWSPDIQADALSADLQEMLS